MTSPKPNPAQLHALRDTKIGRVVEITARKELHDMGLIEQKLGGWVLTRTGEMALAAHPH